MTTSEKSTAIDVIVLILHVNDRNVAMASRFIENSDHSAMIVG